MAPLRPAEHVAREARRDRVVHLQKQEGLTHEEIAVREGLHVNTVRRDLAARGIRTRSPERIAARRKRVAEFYKREWTQQRIADELCVWIMTVNRDLDWLEQHGMIERRDRGEMLSKGLLAYRQTDEGQKRTDAQRTTPRVERTCKVCGTSFTVTATELRHRACLTCSPECQRVERWQRSDAQDTRAKALTGIKRARKRRAEQNRPTGGYTCMRSGTWCRLSSKPGPLRRQRSGTYVQDAWPGGRMAW